MPGLPKQKVAVLGGGAAAMSSVFWLTSRPGWQDDYEITVYQLGWRLGGKGASGRNSKLFGRIEEHGLHVWGGFYENAFKTMRACYDELARPAGSPLATVDEAFVKQSFVVWEEWVQPKGEPGEWRHWELNFPQNSGVPGSGGELPSLWDYMEVLVGWMLEAIRQFPLVEVRDRARSPGVGIRVPGWISQTIKLGEKVVGKVFDGSPYWLLREAWQLVKQIRANGLDTKADLFRIVDYIEAFMRWLEEEFEDVIWDHDIARHLYILMDLGLAVIRGIVVDNVLVDGFAPLDQWDLKEWLERHGAGARALDSAPVWAYYDYFFAYESGDSEKPRMAAGMGLNHLLRLVAGYKGAIFWKMNAGMGDTIFGPMYEVLQRRGVKFEFFHMVEALELDPEERKVSRVRLSKQVNTLNETPYQPMVDVLGLPSWPSKPLWDQIEGGAALEASGVNFEDRFSDWTPVAEVVLEEDRDFDTVVLGISIGEFAYICKDLIARDNDWKDMVEEVQTIQTIALQLWWLKDRQGLGWHAPEAIMTGYAQPMETWADMSQTLPREDWPDWQDAKNVAYFCGPLKNPPAMPVGKDPAFGAGQTAIARQVALDWLAKNLHHIFPEATEPTDPSAVRWELLVDPSGGVGLARFDAQYVRANYTPTERYVVTLPGTTRFQMTADSSGYMNLALAGDWLYTGLGGSVEGAVVAGMQASRALTGFPAEIPGEIKHIPWRRPTTLMPIVRTP
jgi:uncharacterized protein with NAD-binding domain and iron-sulfur cluster